MATSLKPIFLLADSQLLFWRDAEGTRFLDRARVLIDADDTERAPKAAYVGASNSDLPEFYELFLAAMAEIGVRDCRQIPSRPGDADLAFLGEADLILLAGGDVRRGWQVFAETGLKDKVVERYYAGAILVGVSAGAIQLGLKGWSAEGDEVFDTFRLVPFVVDVHDEPSWTGLLRAVPRAGEHARGFGIPTGGGALYHPDYSVEPVRHPLTEVEAGESGLRQALLLPGAGREEEASEPPRVMSQDEVVERALRDLGGPGPGDPVN
ncbi:MAG TPA: Type 1 glutamine amidotransferase-like domain-containing protein [Thermoanaerobaculia bacterium]|nr:Type 1 glutamine amidotransferase-like domain-containing protein [Thermoanaerobaculia bacterium]